MESKSGKEKLREFQTIQEATDTLKEIIGDLKLTRSEANASRALKRFQNIYSYYPYLWNSFYDKVWNQYQESKLVPSPIHETELLQQSLFGQSFSKPGVLTKQIRVIGPNFETVIEASADKTIGDVLEEVNIRASVVAQEKNPGIKLASKWGDLQEDSPLYFVYFS